jgi:MoxR-like ATPase
MSIIFDNVPFVGTQRNELRKLARSHPGFDKWRAINDPTNAMRRPEIIKAIHDLGLENEAEKILGAPQMSAAEIDADEPLIVSNDAAYDAAYESTFDATIDAKEDSEDSEVNEASAIDSDIERVLAPIKPFLASTLVATIESSLRPIVIAAHKPAQVVERQAPVVLKDGEAAHAKRVGMTTMAKAFMVGGARGKRPVTLWNDPLAPKVDPGYVMDGAAMYLAASAFEAGETVWFAGPAGAGKTTRAKEYAAITGRGFVRIGFNHSTEMIDLIGQPEPVPANENGGVKMVWRDGVFTRAIRRAGTVILLDELTGSPPGTSMAFQTILDERQLTLPTGEVVNFADGVVVVIADNTSGYGDESGVYAGTQSANGALVDRSARLIPVDYMSALLEAEALERRTGAPQAACIRLAEFAAKTRIIQAKDGSDSRPFSIRRLIAFANATYRDLLTVDEAWSVTTLSRLPENDREAMRQAIKAHFDDKAYTRELKGEPAPVEPTQGELSQVLQDGLTESRQREARATFSKA